MTGVNDSMSIYYVGSMPYSSSLSHFGIKGQKWGIRRYQNPDGTLTPAGKARYGTDLERMAAKDAQRYSDARAAYGEGAGVRRRLLDKELTQKKKNKEYEKAYDDASKHVNVGKSLKRAEKLHRNSGTFVRGRDLADTGFSHGKNATKALLGAAGSIGLQVAVNSIFLPPGKSFVKTLTMGMAIGSAVGNVAKAARDSYSYEYYERNKKF